jgi:formate hydrogenlyase transcriptional activator
MLHEIAMTNRDSAAGLPQLNELLLELSAGFVRADSSDLDIKIKDGLRAINDYLNFDWITLCEFSGDSRVFNNIYSYSVPVVNAPSISTIRRDTAFLTEKISCGKTVFMPHLPNDLPVAKGWDRTFCINNGIKTSLAIPLKMYNNIVGGLYFASLRRENLISESMIRGLHYFAEILASQIIRRIKYSGTKIVAASQYKIIEQENDYCEIIGSGSAFKQILIDVKQAADTNITVLLSGETGTGKGVIAKAIHNTGSRRDRQMIKVNCASLSPSLIESELFGHEKGAFTGAQTRRSGCFERADGSTLFLDEIGELPLELQAKILRVLEDGEFERVGGSETIKSDVRIIAASNRDLQKEVECGKFRRDLFYRLNIFPIYIPPLRERTEDIPAFVVFFADKYTREFGKYYETIPQKIIKEMQSYYWPGNIRELENLIARSVVKSNGCDLIIELPSKCETASCGTSLTDFEAALIRKTLEETVWRIEGPGGAAKRLGINPSTLRQRMKKFKIERPRQ